MPTITLPAEEVLDHFNLQIDDVNDEPELPPLDDEEVLANTEDDIYRSYCKNCRCVAATGR